jgi:hypothetical protein
MLLSAVMVVLSSDPPFDGARFRPYIWAGTVRGAVERDNEKGNPLMAKPLIHHSWPDDHPTSGAAFARVDTTISCVLTRFRLRSCVSLISFYLAFRRVRDEARRIQGLLQATFLVENLYTCYTLSIWKDDGAITEFGAVRSHVAAANSAFGPTYRNDLKRAEIWSAQFRLWAVSCHNLNWEGLNLQTVLADQWERRQKVATMCVAMDGDRD